MDAATARQELPKTADQFVDQAAKGPWPAFRANGAIDAAAEPSSGVCMKTPPTTSWAISVEDFAALAHDFWIWRAERECEEQCIRIRRGVGVGGKELDRDILEIAGPDMPFLVDSVMGELADQGIPSLAMFHPLAPSRKGRAATRSFRFTCRACRRSGKRRCSTACARRSPTCALGGDFQGMRQRMLDAADELEKGEVQRRAERCR
jgi:NAD-specific glutamate dehydrogenase